VIRSVFGFWRKSLSVRLLLLFIFTCLLLVILLISSARHGFHSQWQVTIKPHLVQYLAYLTEDIGSPPDTQRAVELARVLPVNIYIEGPNTHFSTNNTPLDVSDLSFEQRRYRKRHSKRQNALREKGFEIGEHDDRTVLRHRSGEYSIYFELLHLRPGPHNDGGSLLALLALLATLIGCYCILRKMLKPVADISDGVKRMGAGELNYRIPVRAHNDLGRLVTSINTMASDIEKMLDAKRQLLLGASHELRSPLTRARVATEMLPESSNKQRLTDDLHEMEKLIGDLLESERMNQGHAVLSKLPTTLHQLVDEVCNDLGAPEVSNDVNTDLPDILLDRTRIQLLLRNLIGNALTHGSASATEHQQTQVRSPACRVTAEINPTDNRGSDTPVLTLAVTDNGPGIDPAHIEQLTEPFYRTDESRTRSTGGFGLGLYLCKLIAEAHGGRLHIESTTGTGTTVSVHIPVHFSAHS
jgi:signal transduction histidine kinase